MEPFKIKYFSLKGTEQNETVHRLWENFHNTSDQRYVSGMYRWSRNLIRKQPKKNRQDLNKPYKKIQMAKKKTNKKKPMKRCWTWLIIRGYQIKSTMRGHCIHAKVEELKTPSTNDDAQQLEVSELWALLESKMVQPLWEQFSRFFNILVI